MDTLIGFDSAWTDNAKAPGAICAVRVRGGVAVEWWPPELVSFSGALDFVRRVRSVDGVTLVALDQPTIVPNATGMRPVERVAASLVSWLGGGVQPSNTGRTGMFCAASPVWRFLRDLGAVEDPEAARTATSGLFLMEVFPALALASFDAEFFGRLAAPRYNPGRAKTFRAEDWRRVADSAARAAATLGSDPMAAWCRDAAMLERPRKADQDRLDSVLCTIIAARWRCGTREESLLLGDRTSGYMVLPASAAVRERLTRVSRQNAVQVDGVLQGAAE